MAQASKAIIPKDAGGPYGQRIGVSVQGNVGWALRVNAFVTRRVSAGEWYRYSLVVLNFGVTTLWWFAPATGSSGFADGALRFNATTAHPDNYTAFNSSSGQ
ncbi:hypothetical protein H0H81_005748 [Sphagnurus paluster]|uniref:Uncharacterized protein n=1 Tax=Sphagnurus paluster TaxID=117069 RepID=A0A9P7K5P5_9AGAR|nr:hypothetical protein H0H81_005748 [Sphagnurus paluster]